MFLRKNIRYKYKVFNIQPHYHKEGIQIFNNFPFGLQRLRDTFSKAFSPTTNFSKAKFSKTIFANNKFF